MTIVKVWSGLVSPPPFASPPSSLSVTVTVVGVVIFMRSRAARQLVLSDPEGKTWKAAEAGLEELAGREGRTLSRLRPAGLAEIDGERVDVVADAEFLESGVAVRVVEVEGNRVVVEAVPSPEIGVLE